MKLYFRNFMLTTICFIVIQFMPFGSKSYAIPRALSSASEIAVSYKVPSRGKVDLYMYDIKGKKIKEISFEKGMPGAKPGLNIVLLKKEKGAGTKPFSIAEEPDSFEIRLDGIHFSKDKFQKVDSFKGLFGNSSED